jgi:hypothetical protein
MPPKIDLTKLPMLEVARLYVAAGYSVIPLNYLPGDEDASKRPALRALAQVGSTTLKSVARLWVPGDPISLVYQPMKSWLPGLVAGSDGTSGS